MRIEVLNSIILRSKIMILVKTMDAPYDSTSLEPITTQGLKDPWDPLVNEEIILIGAILIVGGGGGRGNFPINKESLNISSPTLMRYYVVSSRKGTLDPK
jgi:hypothetical protein